MRDAILGLHRFHCDSPIMDCIKGLCLERLLCNKIFKISFTMCVLGIGLQVGNHFIPQSDFIYPVYNFSTLFSVWLLTLGGLLLESAPFIGETADKDWFPRLETFDKRHTLFVYCRADYDESMFLGSDELKERIEKLDAKLDTLIELQKKDN